MRFAKFTVFFVEPYSCPFLQKRLALQHRVKLLAIQYVQFVHIYSICARPTEGADFFFSRIIAYVAIKLLTQRILFSYYMIDEYTLTCGSDHLRTFRKIGSCQHCKLWKSSEAKLRNLILVSNNCSLDQDFN